jgi:hypothetical protein
VTTQNSKLITHNSTSPALVVFQGGVSLSASPLERLVAEAQQAATLDLLAAASASGAYERAFLVTEQTSLAEAALADAGSRVGGLPLTLESVPSTATGGRAGFHFGESLRDLCGAHDLERVVYVGGGALPLGGARDLSDLALAVGGDGECVVSNSLYSADVIAFYPASALDRIALPAADNDLAWLLHFKAGLPFSQMPRTLASQFDVDTPTDLATLWWSAQAPPLRPVVGSRLLEVVDRVPRELPGLAQNVERAYEVMATRRAEVLVAGRVSSWVWRRLETNLPCQTRIVSEERGMRASGRDERGEARSLLGLYADLAGIDGLFDAMGKISNAAFLDTRVLFAHRDLKLSASDRFASDALLPEIISDPWARRLTEAALASPVPIVMGGHSLVSGGVWALSERVRGSASAASSRGR